MTSDLPELSQSYPPSRHSPSLIQDRLARDLPQLSTVAPAREAGPCLSRSSGLLAGTVTPSAGIYMERLSAYQLGAIIPHGMRG